MSTPIAIGQPVNRVDGRHKVTGGAHYAADFLLDNMAYAVVVGSPGCPAGGSRTSTAPRRF
nr:hypothetical protein OG781_36380 [Streptomyces sp. NBC_00830]